LSDITGGQDGIKTITKGDMIIQGVKAANEMEQTLLKVIKTLKEEILKKEPLKKEVTAFPVITEKQNEEAEEAEKNHQMCTNLCEYLTQLRKKSEPKMFMSVLEAVPDTLNAILALSKLFRVDKETNVITYQTEDRLLKLLEVNGYTRTMEKDEEAAKSVAKLDSLLAKDWKEDPWMEDHETIQKCREWRNDLNEEAFLNGWNVLNEARNKPLLVVGVMGEISESKITSWLGQSSEVTAAVFLTYRHTSTGKTSSMAAGSIFVAPYTGLLHTLGFKHRVDITESVVHTGN
jgi:hypothetical protein